MATATRGFTRTLARSSTLRPAVRTARFALPAQAIRAPYHRGYTSDTQQAKSGSSLIWGAVLAAAGGAGAYFYLNGGDVTAKTTSLFTPTKEDYQKVYNEIAHLLVEKDEYDDGSYGPVCYIPNPM